MMSHKTIKSAMILAMTLIFSAPLYNITPARSESKPLVDLSIKTKGIMDAPSAFEKAKNGEIILLDIRSPQEWKETGTGSGAKRVSMHQPGFLQKLDALTGNDKSKPVALICATGGRSNWLQGELVKRGYTNIIDVSEGMLGSSTGPGWLKRGLPVVKN